MKQVILITLSIFWGLSSLSAQEKKSLAFERYRNGGLKFEQQNPFLPLLKNLKSQV